MTHASDKRLQIIQSKFYNKSTVKLEISSKDTSKVLTIENQIKPKQTNKQTKKTVLNITQVKEEFTRQVTKLSDEGKGKHNISNLLECS